MATDVDVVIPCRDEAAALPGLLPRIPARYRVIVVDNGSRDGTADVARSLGAVVVHEPVPGYGSTVHAGILAARPGSLVAVLDGDGSLDPLDLPGLVQAVEAGADLAAGRRRPVGRGSWPLHARLGTQLIAARLRRRGIPVHDIAPIRVAARDAVLALDVRDRRSGYPLELLLRARAAGWQLVERDVSYRPRATGTRSKVSGTVRGTLTAALDFSKVLASAEISAGISAQGRT